MKQSVSSLFEQYLQCGLFADSTVETKRRALMFFTEQFGDLEIGHVTSNHAQRFRKAIADRGVKPRTINTYLRSFSPFFGWVIAEGHIQLDPFGKVKSLPEGGFMLNPYTPRELERMLRVADDVWRAMILLAACCSMRRSEILNLTEADVKFDEEQIWIRPKRDSKDTWPWEIKNHRQAIVGLPEVIRFPHIQMNLPMLLLRLIKSHPEQPYVCPKPSYYKKLIRLKTEKDSLPWRKRNCPWGNFDRDFKSLLKRANVEPKRFHDLRGTYATQLIRNGCDLKEVQMSMRHSNINTTAKYYVFVEEQELVVKSARIAEKCYAT